MNLYRRRTIWASLLVPLVFAIAGNAIAQRRSPHRLRAIALLELTTGKTGVTTAKVTPVTILDAGNFYDASDYKATPEPMALAAGVVYEAQKTGKPVGYVTITRADNAGGWTALGTWEPSSEVAESSSPSVTVPAGAADDRPILHYGGSPAPAAQAPPHAPSAAPSPAAAPVPVAAAPPEDPDRPMLRHTGKEAIANRPASQPKTAASPAPAAAVVSPKGPAPAAGTQTFVAVSDAESSDTRSYEFVWKPGERAPMEAKLRRLALAQFPRQNPPLTEHSLTHVVIRSFDLDLSNDAVMVLTADVPPSPMAQERRGGPSNLATRYIMLIARVDFDGIPQRLAVSMTDSSRLDVTPRMELIDAVDVKGDGYAELLFRQHSFDDKSFVIYNVDRGAATTLFAGASRPLP